MLDYNSIYDFVDGVAKVENDGKYGLINTLGEEILPLSFKRNLFYGTWKLEQNTTSTTLTINKYNIIETKKVQDQDKISVASSYEIYTKNGNHYIKTKTSTYKVDSAGIYDMGGNKFELIETRDNRVVPPPLRKKYNEIP